MRPSNGLALAIVAMAMCTLPFGLVALLRALKVNKYWDAGLYSESEEYARSAKRWATWGIIIGGIFCIIYFIIMASDIFYSDPYYDDYYYDDYYYDDYDYYY